MKRYEKFADDIAELIRSGVLGPGHQRQGSPNHGIDDSMQPGGPTARIPTILRTAEP